MDKYDNKTMDTFFDQIIEIIYDYSWYTLI